MTIELPAELLATVMLPETVGVADVLDFLQKDGIKAGLGEAAFYTLTDEIRGLRGNAAIKVRRDGSPTSDALSEISEETFREGFQITGPSGVIGFQSAAQYAWTGGDWDPNSGEERLSGWRLSCYGNETFSPVTGKDFPKSDHVEIFQRNLDRFCAFASAAANSLPVETAVVQRKDTAVRSPLLPLVEFDYVLFAAKPETIAQDYADLDAFGAAWDDAKAVENGLSVFTRGTEIQDQNAFWRHAIEKQVDLARAAKPGRVRYPAPRLKPGREEKISNLPRYLEQVGYDANAETIEFTAYVPDDRHLGIRDLYELAGLKRDGLPSGDPLKKIVVTFADEAMAKREAHPLFDIGVTVQYFGSDGAFHTMKQPT